MNILYFASLDFYSKPNPSYHLMLSLMLDILNNSNTLFYVGQAEEGNEIHIPKELHDNPHFHSILIRTKPVPKSHFFKRYLSGVKYSKNACKKVKEIINHVDVIFVQSSPTVYYSLRGLRKFTNKPIVYNVQDMFPGSTIACGKMNNKIMQKYFYSLQKKAYSKADIITAISEDMKVKLMEQNVSAEKIKVIVNWFNDDAVFEIPREKNLFIKKYDMQPNIFYVQYAGTMGFVFDYHMVLSVAKILKNHTDIVFQMIGIGSQKDSFIKEAEEQGLSNIVFLPLEPQEMVPHVYSACDVCFIPLKKGIIGNSVPSKAGLLMACRRPIVTTADAGSIYNKMINEEGIGIACSTDDHVGAANALLKMKNDISLRRLCGEKGHDYGEVLYSRKHNTLAYLELFASLSKK